MSVPVFLALWIPLGILGFVAFQLNRNAKFKHQWFRWWVIFMGVFFVGSVATMEGGPSALALIPFVVLTVGYNVWVTRFCDTCGQTVFPILTLGRVKFCPKCGANLDK